MALGRISTYAVFQNTLRDATRVQEELMTLQNQLSSGQKSKDFEGIASQAEQFIDLDSRISKTDQYVINNKLVQSRLNGTNAALSQIIDTAMNLKNIISTRRNAAASNGVPFDVMLRGAWQSLTGQLNSNAEGRYLFSGSRTDTPAVNSNDFPSLVYSGVPDTGYYQGSDQDVSVRPQDGVEFNYNIRADDPAFQKIMAGLAMAQKGDTYNDDSALQAAYTLVDEGLKGVIGLQATVNTNTIALEQTNEQHNALKLYWKSMKEEINNTDIIAASTQVAINQGILQASFQAFAKINSLRLSDYLR